jgi:hypothetical protein
MSDAISVSRTEILRLRARIVAVERTALAALEAMLRIRPEALELLLESTRKGLAEAYQDSTFAPDLIDPNERIFVAEEVERLLRALQAEMDFKGGVRGPETG